MTAQVDPGIVALEQTVAALRQALREREAERDAALARRSSEHDERLAHQAAAIEVLKQMSASPADPQPVFDLICRQAKALLDTAVVGLFEYDGTLVHHRAASTAEYIDPGASPAYLSTWPRVPDRGSLACRAILDGTVIHIRDLDAEPGISSEVRTLGHKAQVAIPLMRDSRAIGAIAAGSPWVDGITDTQIDLLKTFAEQAVIAMGSAETFRALRDRTAELALRTSEYGERIEHQSATIDVLKAMSGSPGDAQPVLELIARRARDLCGAETTGVFSFDGGTISVRCVDSVDTQSLEPFLKTFPRPPARDYTIGRAILDRQAVEIDDADADPNLAQVVHAHRNRSIISLPFLVDDRVLGGISIAVRKPGGLTESQKALARTLAEQASIAIGAAGVHRRLQERTDSLQESLEYQTATSDVLKISSRPLVDLASVPKFVCQAAARLSEVTAVSIFRLGNGVYRWATGFGIETGNRAVEEQAAMQEALERQTATAEVLEMINASPGDLAPVFDLILEKAMRLCGVAFGMLSTWDGEHCRVIAARGLPPLFAENIASNLTTADIPPLVRRMIGSRHTVHILDSKDGEDYRAGFPAAGALVDLGGARTTLQIPLVKEEAVLGHFSFYRQEVRPFSGKEIALLENFAAQAVIAMESARLLNELRARTDELAQRQAELRVTFENMGDGVAMFDETPRLVAWNRKFQDILDLPDGVLAERLTFNDHIRYLAERGEYGAGVDPDTQIRLLTEAAGQPYAMERTRPDGRVIEVRHNPVAGGGFVLIYADITERKRNEAQIAAARDAAEAASRTIENAFRELKSTQANLIQAEKMASLGQLTAGIAHEIKNPLNFVNNFASLSVELLAELKETVAKAQDSLDNDQRAEVEELSAMLTNNLQKITEHGKRADGIVRSMLEHSRGASGERRKVDISTLADEALNLAYHGARAQNQSFNVTLERDFAAGLAPIEVNPQDLTRVFLNIFSNGFYAANKRARNGAAAGFEPTLKVSTRDAGKAVEVRIRDNGTGIPPAIRDQLFQPFFTTKPTGEGTGLGLSITYDIVTQQHGGTILVDSEVDTFTEFVVTLPREFGHGAKA